MIRLPSCVLCLCLVCVCGITIFGSMEKIRLWLFDESLALFGGKTTYFLLEQIMEGVREVDWLIKSKHLNYCTLLFFAKFIKLPFLKIYSLALLMFITVSASLRHGLKSLEDNRFIDLFTYTFRNRSNVHITFRSTMLDKVSVYDV